MAWVLLRLPKIKGIELEYLSFMGSMKKKCTYSGIKVWNSDLDDQISKNEPYLNKRIQ